MADFEAPALLEETQEAEDPISALMALARQQEKRRQEGLERLRAMSAAQAGQAQGLRGASALLSAGQNPLIQGLQRDLGSNAAQLEGLAAQAGARADAMDRGGVDPLGIARLQQLAEYQKGQLAQRKAEAEAKAQAAKDRAAAGAAAAEKKEADKRTAAEAKATGMANEKVAGATERLGKAIVDTGAPGFYARYDEAQELLSKHQKDIPGFGRIEGRLPDEMVSPEGRQLRFLVGQMLSEYRKGQTGAGMSDAERLEYGRITGLVNSGNDAGLKQGLEILKRALDARVQATGAGFRPEAVDAISRRAPRLGQALRGGQEPGRTPATKAMPTDASGALSLADVPTPPRLPPAPPGKVYVRFPGDEKPKLIPADKLAEATGPKWKAVEVK